MIVYTPPTPLTALNNGVNPVVSAPAPYPFSFAPTIGARLASYTSPDIVPYTT